MDFTTRLLACAPALRRFLSSKSPSNLRLCSVEDLVQEVWLSAWRHQSMLSKLGLARFEAWLIRTARNRMIDAVRHEKVCQDLKARKGPRRVELSEETPSKEMMRFETRATMTKAMDGLSARECRIARAFFLEGRSVNDIANREGSTEAAVRGVLKRASDRLRGRLRAS